MNISSSPLISVCVPVHDMENGDFFLERLQSSLEAQTFQDFEVIVTQEGKMAENTNAAIRKAKGKIVKVLFMDDYLYSEKALQHIAENFKGGWFVTGCVHDDGVKVGAPHVPMYTPGSLENSIGSPSVLAFENDKPLMFDESLSWMLDVDLYTRLYDRYGFPTLFPSMDVAIGLGSHQMTNILSDKEKDEEVEYVQRKHN